MKIPKPHIEITQILSNPYCEFGTWYLNVEVNRNYQIETSRIYGTYEELKNVKIGDII